MECIALLGCWMAFGLEFCLAPQMEQQKEPMMAVLKDYWMEICLAQLKAHPNVEQKVHCLVPHLALLMETGLVQLKADQNEELMEPHLVPHLASLMETG